MAVITHTDFQKRLNRRRLNGQIFYAVCLLAVVIALAMLAALLYNVLSQGLTRLSWDFLTSFPSQADITLTIMLS